MVIQHLGKKSIQTHRDIESVLRHIIKNVSERLFHNIQSPDPVVEWEFVFFENRFLREIHLCHWFYDKKQESPVQISIRNPTELILFQELLKRLQDRHVDCDESLTKKSAADVQEAVVVSTDTPSVMETMILFQ